MPQIYCSRGDGKLPYGRNTLIRFQAEYIFEMTDEAETKLKYKNIEKIIFGKDVIYIYTSAIQAFLIPFSVFETQEKRDEFCAFLNQKMVEAE